MDPAVLLKVLGTTINGRLTLGARGPALRRNLDLSAPTTLPERRFGRTGVMLPILGLGGWYLGDAGSERAAAELVETALVEGVRFFDNAESYHGGTSERWLGAALESLGARHHAFLATKTYDPTDRSRETAARHLEGSLRRLRTDHLDLWQLHGVRSAHDVDRAFRRGGAMQYLVEAQQQSIVRYIGVTGHQDPAANLRALHYWDEGIRFDTMQIPLNPIDHHQRSFERQVLPELVKRDIGVVAMKTSAEGRLLRGRVCTSAECHRYVWSLPVSVAVVGMERPAFVRENARVARAFSELGDADRGALLDRVAPRTSLRLEPYKEWGF
jgi:aryl-alcohol dehydrogenase-like predicted oxidoreductase